MRDQSLGICHDEKAGPHGHIRSYLSVTWVFKMIPFNMSSLYSVILSYCCYLKL